MPAAASRRARPPARHDHAPRPRREHDGPSRPAQQRQKHGDHQFRTGQDHSRPGSGGAADGQPGPGDTGAVVPGAGPAGPTAVNQAATQGATVIPGLPAATGSQDADQAPPRKAADHKARQPAAPQPAPEQSAEQQFITEVSPGAVATQRKYGIPASVTIAQAIVESGWGTSGLATRDHNLFGIKGAGPAGSDPLPTREYEHGRPVTRRASFRVYHDVAQSIEDHGRLLATSGFYTHAMAARHQPDTFASALTGVYATDPDYGGKLISLMRRHDLYRYDSAHVPAPRAAAAPAGPGDQAAPGGADIPGAEQAPPAAAPPPPDGSQTGSPGGAATPPPPSSRPVPAASTPPPTAGTPPPTPGTPPSTTPPPMTGTPPPASTPPPSPGTPSPSTTPPSNTTPPTIPAPPAATPSPAAAAQAVAGATAATAPQTVSATEFPAAADAAQGPRRRAAKARPGPRRYQEQMPAVVKKAFFTRAKGRLLRTESLYRDVASASGIGWELLAACDWMQCEARDRWSPVHGERLGSANLDGTIYFTRSEALAQCADDLVNLAWAVYRIDLTAGRDLSVRDLASAFAAFRWGGLLKAHRTSAMEFPYSVAGLTEAHLRMRWPDISDPRAPDKPGTRFRMPFGAIPVVLGLNYQATV
jgi:flagellum-specific peptidoglycan hydrolase FlgJ